MRNWQLLLLYLMAFIINYQEDVDPKQHSVNRFLSVSLSPVFQICLRFFKFNFVPSMSETTKVIQDVC